MARLTSIADAGRQSGVKDKKKEVIQAKYKKKNALMYIGKFCNIIRSFAYFTREGITTHDAVSLLAADAVEEFKGPLTDVRDMIINDGISPADAFYRTGFFPEEFISILRVGQSSGKLAESLVEYSKFLKSRLEMSRSFDSALKYPLFMINVTLIGGTGMILGIVPQLKKSMGAVAEGKELVLPLATRIIFGMYDMAMAMGVPGVILLMCSLVYYLVFGAGKRHIMGLVNKIPKVKYINNELGWAQWLVMAGICIGAGMTEVQMLQVMKSGKLPKELAKGKVYDNLLFNIQHGGQMLSSEFKKVGVENEIVSIVAMGERRGGLREMMAGLGEQKLDDLPPKIEGTKVLINNLSIGVITLIAGLLCYSILMTMFATTNMIS